MNKRWTKMLVVILPAVLLLYGVAYWLIISPLKEERQALGQQVSMYEQQYNRLQKQEDDSLKGRLDAISKSIPDQKRPAEMVKNLQSMAETANVAITHISSQDTNQQSLIEDDVDDVVLAYTYALDVHAKSIADLNQFLTALRDSRRLLVLNTLSVRQTRDDVHLSLTFRTFSSS
ncbi:hypothetical protein EU245_01620 [Lentibacillus lipolyticus]|nr:hypothetical protein EU245_01620 [Lentibacillus lipolyticus]